VRKGHHHFKIGGVAVKRAAHFPSIGNAGDFFPAASATIRAAFVWWQRCAILVQKADILHRSIPINVTGIVRLVIGAAFQERNGA
jgi:hypothetical protein